MAEIRSENKITAESTNAQPSENLSPDQEKEMVERAKKALMRYLNMSEPEAHKFIVHQAMNLRRTKRDIAAGILTAYEL